MFSNTALCREIQSTHSIGVVADGRCLALSVKYNNNMALASIDIFIR